MNDDGGNIIEGLRKLRSQEQGVRSYASSSRWYTGTTLAISWLEQGLNATSPAERFRYAWSALYNLYMMTHARGDIENTTMSRWAGEIQNAPKVRQIAAALPEEFLPALLKAKNALLYDAEKKKPREALNVINAWQQKRERGQELPPGKACVYLFLIGRDIRNALSHPTLDVNSANTKKALKLAADIFLPLAAVAIEATIEHPPAGTTGRATAYRSFLYPFLKNTDSVFSDYYLERLFPEEELNAFPEEEAKQLLRKLAKSHETRRAALSRADAETTLRDWCEPILFAELGFAAHGGVRIVTDDGIFEPTGVVAQADLAGGPRAEYRGKEAGGELACLVWVFAWGASLDAVSRDDAFPELTLMEVAQRALARADVEWAILTNGQRLRLLSKRTAHKVRSFLEVDLAALIDRWTDREAQLAFRYTLGLFSQDSLVARDEQGRTRLDRAVQKSEQHGREISDELKRNVFGALEELGQGFLDYLRTNPEELEAWRVRRAPSAEASEFLASDELLTDVYHESLSLMYRLLFLFYAESRDLLPMENEVYRESYSLESIRDDIIATHDDPDPKRFFSRGATDLWDRLKQLFAAVNKGWANIIPAYNGGLFDPKQHDFLEEYKVSDYHLARAIDLLSRTKPGAVRGEGRKKVTYRDLDIRHLGSIYEGILEYHAEIADEEKVVVKRGTGGKAAEEYVGVSELTADERKQLKAYREALAEDEENPQLPRGCKVTGLIEPGEYYLIYGGRESKRKSSGSYYTPDYIVQYIVENTLGPLVRGECRPKPAPVPALLGDANGIEEEAEEARPLTSDEILELKVLDPAMGSGHFLVAATEYLARAYGAACVREGKDPDGVMSDDEFVRYKRMVAERCIYGVDINPMAVELAKLSMWLFTMDRGRPLSFLDHHLKNGNALIGAWIKDLGTPPEFDTKGKLKKHRRKDTRTGNLFEVRFREKVPLMVQDLFGIMQQETRTPSDIQLKKTLDHTVEDMRQPFRNLADIWVGLHFGEEADDYNALLLNVGEWRNRVSEEMKSVRPFHWELEFPEVWFDENGKALDGRGFSAVIGNPPYVEGKNLHYPDVLRLFYSSHEPQAGDNLHPSSAKLNTYCLFLELGLKLITKDGHLGYMVPVTFLRNKRYWRIREIVLQEAVITNICEVMDFDAASVECISLILSRSAADETMIEVDQISGDGILHLDRISPTYSRQDSLYQINIGIDEGDFELMAAIEKHCQPLSEICETKDGINPGRADFRQVFLGTKDGELFKPLADNLPEYRDEELARPSTFNPAIHKATCEGADISALASLPPPKYYLVYSEAIAYVERFFVPSTRWSAQLRERAIFEHCPKILSRQTANTIIATIDTNRFYPINNVHITYPTSVEVDLYVVAALLNSKVVRWYYRKRTGETGKTFPQVHIYSLKQLPMPALASANKLVSLRTSLQNSVVDDGLSQTHLKVISAQDMSVAQAWLSEIARKLCSISNLPQPEREKLLQLADDVAFKLYNLSAIQRDRIETSMHITSPD